MERNIDNLTPLSVAARTVGIPYSEARKIVDEGMIVSERHGNGKMREHIRVSLMEFKAAASQYRRYRPRAKPERKPWKMWKGMHPDVAM